MPNNCLSVLYKRIIQVENKNVGLKVGGGGAQTYHCPPQSKKCGGGGTCPPCPPASYASDLLASRNHNINSIRSPWISFIKGILDECGLCNI